MLLRFRVDNVRFVGSFRDEVIAKLTQIGEPHVLIEMTFPSSSAAENLGVREGKVLVLQDEI